MSLILSGGDVEKDLQMKRSEINHLRLLLGWMRCQYMLDENMQRGFLEAAKWCADNGVATEERSMALVRQQAEKIDHVPKYVRQAVKMLSKAVHDHEKNGDMVDGEPAMRILPTAPPPTP